MQPSWPSALCCQMCQLQVALASPLQELCAEMSSCVMCVMNICCLVGAWERFGSVSQSAVAPSLLLKTIPAVSNFVSIQRHPKLQRQLQEFSIVYRLFQFLL